MTEKFINFLKFFLFFAFIFNNSLSAEKDITIGSIRILAPIDLISKSETHEIAAEIANLKENDIYTKKFIAIKDPGIKYYLTATQKAKVIAKLDENEQIKTNFILDSFFLNNFRAGASLVSQEQAPALHMMIKNLTDKAKISMPFIFISFDKNLYNAFALTYSKKLTALVISEPMIKDMTDKQLQAILAHELGHIKNDNKEKISYFDKFFNHITFALCSCISFPLALMLIQKIMLDSKSKSILESITKNWPLLACNIPPILYAFIGCYILWIKRHNQQNEIDADQFAIEITNDPESFVESMEKLKNYFIKNFEDNDANVKLFEERVDELKSIYTTRYDELNKIIKKIRTNLLKSKNEILETGGTHPAMNKRIEFGKKEIEKKKQTTTVHNEQDNEHVDELKPQEIV